MSQAQTADPIPEAPADEEVEGLAQALRNLAEGAEQEDRTILYKAAAALRRSTETDKPGVREQAADLVTIDVGSYNQGCADALAKAAKVAATFVSERLYKPGFPACSYHSREIFDAIRALSASPLTEEQSAALQDVVAERKRQVQAEGWTLEHDDGHAEGEMGQAAGVYALAASSYDYRWVLCGSPVNDYLAATFKMWPWDWSWFKPTNRRRDLVKAGALIIAEIERLDRLPRSTTGGAK